MNSTIKASGINCFLGSKMIQKPRNSRWWQ